MQANRRLRSSDEREDKGTQRAVLALLLHEFPVQMTRDDLKWRGFGDAEALANAIRNLETVDLLWCQGAVVLPTLAARHFDWLESP
jgi:hypothetical protein